MSQTNGFAASSWSVRQAAIYFILFAVRDHKVTIQAKDLVPVLKNKVQLK
ncbi:MAG: hypothetical protein J7K09_05795 [Desulfuromusa sp.]|nr:hypothetical protein [Desulfuromusa sp.]